MTPLFPPVAAGARHAAAQQQAMSETESEEGSETQEGLGNRMAGGAKWLGQRMSLPLGGQGH